MIQNDENEESRELFVERIQVFATKTVKTLKWAASSAHIIHLVLLHCSRKLQRKIIENWNSFLGFLPVKAGKHFCDISVGTEEVYFVLVFN